MVQFLHGVAACLLHSYHIAEVNKSFDFCLGLIVYTTLFFLVITLVSMACWALLPVQEANTV
jgi:hypothetical protein